MPVQILKGLDAVKIDRLTKYCKEDFDLDSFYTLFMTELRYRKSTWDKQAEDGFTILNNNYADKFNDLFGVSRENVGEPRVYFSNIVKSRIGIKKSNILGATVDFGVNLTYPEYGKAAELFVQELESSFEDGLILNRSELALIYRAHVGMGYAKAYWDDSDCNEKAWNTGKFKVVYLDPMQMLVDRNSKEINKSDAKHYYQIQLAEIKELASKFPEIKESIISNQNNLPFISPIQISAEDARTYCTVITCQFEYVTNRKMRVLYSEHDTNSLYWIFEDDIQEWKASAEKKRGSKISDEEFNRIITGYERSVIPELAFPEGWKLSEDSIDRVSKYWFEVSFIPYSNSKDTNVKKLSKYYALQLGEVEPIYSESTYFCFTSGNLTTLSNYHYGIYWDYIDQLDQTAMLQTSTIHNALQRQNSPKGYVEDAITNIDEVKENWGSSNNWVTVSQNFAETDPLGGRGAFFAIDPGVNTVAEANLLYQQIMSQTSIDMNSPGAARGVTRSDDSGRKIALAMDAVVKGDKSEYESYRTVIQKIANYGKFCLAVYRGNKWGVRYLVKNGERSPVIIQPEDEDLLPFEESGIPPTNVIDVDLYEAQSGIIIKVKLDDEALANNSIKANVCNMLFSVNWMNPKDYLKILGKNFLDPESIYNSAVEWRKSLNLPVPGDTRQQPELKNAQIPEQIKSVTAEGNGM